MYRPKAIEQPEQLASAVAEIERKLAPDVVRLRYNIQPDWYGDPAIFFKILLTDDASRPVRLREVAPRTVFFIEKELDSFNSWGLFSHYNFRSQSELEQTPEPAWA